MPYPANPRYGFSLSSPLSSTACSRGSSFDIAFVRPPHLGEPLPDAFLTQGLSIRAEVPGGKLEQKCRATSQVGP
jgi:hypothetical protein